MAANAPAPVRPPTAKPGAATEMTPGTPPPPLISTDGRTGGAPGPANQAEAKRQINIEALAQGTAIAVVDDEQIRADILGKTDPHSSEHPAARAQLEDVAKGIWMQSNVRGDKLDVEQAYQKQEVAKISMQSAVRGDKEDVMTAYQKREAERIAAEARKTRADIAAQSSTRGDQPFEQSGQTRADKRTTLDHATTTPTSADTIQASQVDTDQPTQTPVTVETPPVATQPPETTAPASTELSTESHLSPEARTRLNLFFNERALASLKARDLPGFLEAVLAIRAQGPAGAEYLASVAARFSQNNRLSDQTRMFLTDAATSLRQDIPPNAHPLADLARSHNWITEDQHQILTSPDTPPETQSATINSALEACLKNNNYQAAQDIVANITGSTLSLDIDSLAGTLQLPPNTNPDKIKRQIHDQILSYRSKSSTELLKEFGGKATGYGMIALLILQMLQMFVEEPRTQ